MGNRSVFHAGKLHALFTIALLTIASVGISSAQPVAQTLSVTVNKSIVLRLPERAKTVQIPARPRFRNGRSGSGPAEPAPDQWQSRGLHIAYSV